MSLVTEVIIIGFCTEKNTRKTELLNNYLKNKGHLPLKEIKESCENKWLGGEKVFTSYLLIGSFNYLDINDFLQKIRSINWECKEDIKILIQEENIDEYYFKEYKI